MKKTLLLIMTAAYLGMMITGCDLVKSEEDESGIVTLTGQVLNVETNNAVPNAYIRVLPYDLLFEADEEGFYTFDVEIDSTMDLRVSATKDGFNVVSTTVLALAGRVVTVPTLSIYQTEELESVSGHASNILLLGQSAQSIGVRDSGSEEVATVTFQVADSLGRPVVLSNKVTVNFALGVAPGGGEFIYPESALTDNNGQVIVNLSSGTRAGVVQIVAEVNVDGRTLRSLPVSVAIHGGLPDQAHFSIGPEKFNFPGLRTLGLFNPVTVYVGDKYSNPVKEGTAVYFATDAGIIEGSVLTNSYGGGTARLISANPLPTDGIGVMTATTADENQQHVSSRTAVVFSGVPVVTVEPSVVLLDQTYNLTVTDQNGNPLVEGTNIFVRVEGTKVKAVGNTNVRLDDTAFIGGLTYDDVLRGPGITEFTFRAVEDLTYDEDGFPTVETITITVTGGNGSLEIVLGEEGAALQARAVEPGEEVIVETLSIDKTRVRLLQRD